MALPSKIKLEIVTPEKMFFSGEVDEVVVPGVDGALGILPGHAALLSQLSVGVIRYRVGSQQTKLYCGGGYVEVLPDTVSVLADAALSAQEIDASEAKADLAKAEQDLKSRHPEADYDAARHDLAAASARLEAAS